MSLRRFATGAALALAGLVAAVGIGLLANSISGDNVGLSAEPLSAGETLAPHADDRARDRAKQRAARERAAARRRAQREAQQPADTVEVPAPGPAPTTTTFDDHGGLRDGSDDNSGSGSGSSGSGSGGSDDSGKIDDD
jgi:membrane protein involved in colicin uptake